MSTLLSSPGQMNMCTWFIHRLLLDQKFEIRVGEVNNLVCASEQFSELLTADKYFFRLSHSILSDSLANIKK